MKFYVKETRRDKRILFAAVCGGHIVGDEGTIQSPRFPENYAPDANCNWVIKVPKKFQVALTFQYFNVGYFIFILKFADSRTDLFKKTINIAA